ncbi:MAG: hypothetical protein ACOVO1_02280 [Chitinophagaceae bacterium]
MKKTTLTLAITFGISSVFAQNKAFKDLEKNYLLGKLEASKDMIDKIVADPANANFPETWAWKSTIDAEMSSSDELKAKCADCFNTSFDAFRKYENLDKSYNIISQVPFKWKPLGILYDGFYNLGREAYKEKNWVVAFENFEKSASFSKIIMSKDIRKNKGALDTLPILMTAYAAQNAQKVKDALAYYAIAAELKYGGETDIDMYKYLIYNYSELKDKANFEKYFAIAKEKYPKENFDDYKFDFINKNYPLEEKIAYYDAEDAKGGLNALAYMSFGDMFANLKKDDKEALEKDAAKKESVMNKGRDAFKKAYKQNNDLFAGFNVAVLYYNEFNETDDKRLENVKKMQEINTNKTIEKDPKKKAAVEAKIKEQIEPIRKANLELEAKIQSAADNAVEWLEKTFAALKDKTEKSKQEKTTFKNTVKFLGALYEFKREKAKTKDPKSYDSFDAKSKQYYEMYDKL